MLRYILDAETIVVYGCDVWCRIKTNFWEYLKIRRDMIDEHMSAMPPHSCANRPNAVNDGKAAISEVAVEQWLLSTLMMLHAHLQIDTAYVFAVAYN